MSTRSRNNPWFREPGPPEPVNPRRPKRGSDIPFSFRRWLECLWRGHDDYLTHQREVTDYHVCLHCGRESWRFNP